MTTSRHVSRKASKRAITKKVQCSKKQPGAGLYDEYRQLYGLESHCRRFRVTKVLHATEKALCLRINNNSYWFPKSVIKFGVHPAGHSFAVDIPIFMALEKRLVARL